MPTGAAYGMQDLDSAAAAASDPTTPPSVLARIVTDHPSLRPQVAANPSCYRDLLDWLAGLRDPAVDEALRRGETGP